jgi:hypothetical protein
MHDKGPLEKILELKEREDEVDIFEHPNQKRYPGQKISVVLIRRLRLLGAVDRVRHGNLSQNHDSQPESHQEVCERSTIDETRQRRASNSQSV